MSKAIRILMVPADEYGCGLYRMQQPAYAAAKYADGAQDADVDIILNMNPTPADLKDKDLLILQRVRISRNEQTKQILDLNVDLMNAAKYQDIPVIYEHDDNDFALPRHHGMYQMFVEDRIADKVDFMLENTDYITTTTQYLADVFGKRISNPNKIYVFPNCIVPEDPIWGYKRPSSKKIRIGWAGGSSHHQDLMEFRGVADALYDKYGDKLLFMMGGFDTRGIYSYYNEKGERITRGIEEHETIWIDMADEFFGKIPKTARRILRTLPVDKYGYFFSQFDIGIIPLQSEEFSRAKSSLKILEFGMYSVPCAISDVVPYNITTKGTGLERMLVSTGISKKATSGEWIRILSELIEDEAMRQAIGKEINQLVLSKFDANKWAPLRCKFWKDIVDSQVPETPRAINEA